MGVVIGGVHLEIHTPKLVPRPSGRGVLYGGSYKGDGSQGVMALAPRLTCQGETNELKNFDRNQTEGNSQSVVKRFWFVSFSLGKSAKKMKAWGECPWVRNTPKDKLRQQARNPEKTGTELCPCMALIWMIFVCKNFEMLFFSSMIVIRHFWKKISPRPMLLTHEMCALQSRRSKVGRTKCHVSYLLDLFWVW